MLPKAEAQVWQVVGCCDLSKINAAELKNRSIFEKVSEEEVRWKQFVLLLGW
ncbi:MAG: hypothetical protein KatS3mg087_1034 [Patescibacteria group bacterium]|nr:MAG: hypothetical protein KatS3mg087_1034 [Patescibacteria group bacterium]